MPPMRPYSPEQPTDMDEGKHPRTARDALILEALGDIGDLLAKADALNRTLAPTVVALQHAQTADLTAAAGTYRLYGRGLDNEAALGRGGGRRMGAIGRKKPKPILRGLKFSGTKTYAKQTY